MAYIASTFSLAAALRRSLLELQRDLARSQRELSTGRHADLGVSLGRRAEFNYSVVGTHDALETIFSTNQLVTTRLDATQAALSNLLSNAQAMRATLLAAQNDGGAPDAIETQARLSLANIISTLNGADGNSFLFGGVNSDAAPVNDYFADPPPPNKIALDAAFVAAFGFSQSDPAVATITSAQIEAFLSGPFAALFSPAGWTADWSHTSDQPLQSRISLTQTIDSSVSANEPAMRKLAMAYAIMSELGASRMNPTTYRAVLVEATQTIDEAIGLVTKTQAKVGVMQRAVANSDDAMTVSSNALETQLHRLESVDPAEAAARVNSLMTRIETVYELTARMTQLSLAKYL